MASGNERLSVKAIDAWARHKGRKAGHKLADGGGLYLTFLPSGAVTWQVRYSMGGKVRTLSLGPYPGTSLAEARAARRKAMAQVAEGLDPMTERKALRAEGLAAAAQTFELVAREWLRKQAAEWSDVHLTKSKRALERDVFPTLGALPVARVTTAAVAAVINGIQKRGVRETAQKVLQHVRSVFRFAQARGLRTDNPAEPVVEILEAAPPVRRHPALLTFPELGDVLRRMDAAPVTPAVRLCHRLIAFTAVRVANATAARWEHFDLEANVPVWRIPRAEMKVSAGRDHAHVVLLPESIAAELRRWRATQPLDAEYVFPGNQGRVHISRESVEKALRDTVGLRGKHSPHGWRSAFSTRAREDTDFDGELIDLSLDHVHSSSVARAYDRGIRLEKRVALAKWWGDALRAAES